jgi:hypothetical protein
MSAVLAALFAGFVCWQITVGSIANSSVNPVGVHWCWHGVSTDRHLMEQP